MDINAITKTIEIKGEQFPVVDFGTGPAVLLLHGFPSSSHIVDKRKEAQIQWQIVL